MTIINERTIESIATTLRPLLICANIGGIREWDPVFSNGCGLGDQNTLVVSMKPADHSAIPSPIPISWTDLLLAVKNRLQELGHDTETINISAREHHGFYLIIKFKLS